MNGRANQRLRTRKDLLQAAGRLVAQGKRPSLEEIAEEALVSRATAYRHFPNVESLLLEAALDVAAPQASALFGEDAPSDPAERVLRVDTAFHDMILANETPLRIFLAHALQQSVAADAESDAKTRQNRRTPLIQAALEPASDAFAPKQRELLERALALIVGSEAMVVCKDVLGLEDEEAREVKRWAIRALVAAARKPDDRADG